MYPILTRTDYGFLYSFTAVWGLFILLGLYFLQKRDSKKEPFSWLIVVLIGAILGGRVQYLLLNSEYFTENSTEFWHFYNGGLAYHGALWGGLLATAVYSLYKRTDWFTQLAIYPLWLTLAHTAGWTACWLEGCAHGRPTFIGWGAAELPDSFGVLAVRYQTQLWGIVLSFALAIAYWRWQQKKNTLSTASFWSILALLQLIHIAVALWRGDEMVVWQGVRLDIWLSLLTTAVSLLMVGWQALRKQNRTAINTPSAPT